MDELRALLQAVRRRWRTEVGLRAAARGTAAAATLLLVTAAAARLLTPSDGTLTFLFLVAFLAAVGVAAVIVWRIPRKPGDRQMARFVEERVARQPDIAPLDDVLVSALKDAWDSAEDPGFAAFVRDHARRRLEQIGAATIVTAQALRRAGLEALAGAALLVVAIAVSWPMLTRVSETAWVALLPQLTRVEVTPGNARVVAGRPVVIRASVYALGRPLTRFSPVITITDGADERSTIMTPGAGGGFVYQPPADRTFEYHWQVSPVDRTFKYRITAGSARSAEYTVTALLPARAQRIDLRYEYPAFAKLPVREETNGGDIFAPAGTKVRVKVHTDKPVTSGQLALAGGGRALTPTSERVLEGELTLSKDDSYRVALTDVDGLESTGGTEYFIRVMDDRPPDVHILRPGGDQQITPLEEVAIEARAQDDYGIARFELVYAVAGREPKIVPFTRATGSDVSKTGAYVIAAEELRVQPGDVISYYARARDVGRGKRSTETKSDMFFLEVRPFSEEYVLAQSQGMAGVAPEQLEGLIAAQKEIITATWNIERRAASGAGRSAADITAIADAQAELRARVERAMAGATRGRPMFMREPQQINLQPRQLRGRSGPDPVGAALSAMTRAVDHLQGQKPAEALSHEMAALQALLQAQAEIRRREVSRQTSSAMGAMGRQGQDLSALFDKELQRQQQTNYESRPQTSEPPSRDNEESALDRIRDLARRQEDLSRRQRELAKAGLQPDELKRRLETLSREQEALREQAEQIARQMGQQGSQPQRGASPQQGQGGGSGEMRHAAEEMRGSADDLQRQSLSSAAGRAESAASRLRKLEQQMRADSPEARQRAAGELRLEAQQVADEQRRIADEADRLEKGSGTANADAWRRLAGEKDKLADRVDDLKRGAEQLAVDGKDRQGGAAGQQAQQASQAAREIERQGISNQMREGAKEMRAPAAGENGSGRGPKPEPRQNLAAGEQHIARALDGIVDRLAGGQGDAQDLARQLDETRGMRERLDQLQRQVREAESKAAAGRRGRASGTESGSSSNESLERLRGEYARELQRSRETMQRLERGPQGASGQGSSPRQGSGQSGAGGGATPEQHEWSVTDQGTEAFKQDFSKWESLRKEIDSAIERYEASIVASAARKSVRDRLSAGGSDRVPDAYRRLIARYYESLARKK